MSWLHLRAHQLAGAGRCFAGSAHLPASLPRSKQGAEAPDSRLSEMRAACGSQTRRPGVRACVGDIVRPPGRPTTPVGVCAGRSTARGVVGMGAIGFTVLGGWGGARWRPGLQNGRPRKQLPDIPRSSWRAARRSNAKKGGAMLTSPTSRSPTAAWL
jgi:hypothetical protein